MDESIERVEAFDPARWRALVRESEPAGFAFLRRLLDDWQNGANGFDRPGEILLAATRDGLPIGVCGLNVDPYAADDRVGRVRHLYALASARRNGIGRRLVAEIVARACGRFDVLRLRTDDARAASFYAALGFVRCSSATESATHVLSLARAPRSRGGV